MHSKKTLFFLLKLCVSSALLFWLYRKTPIGEIRELFADSNLTLLPLIFALFFVNTILSALKWRILLQSDNLNIPLAKLVVSYLIGGFFNLFLPSNIGGDSYRIYDVMQKSQQGVRSAASVFADRLTGFVALVCLSLLSSVIVAVALNRPAFILLPLAILSLLVLMLYLLWQRTIVEKLLNILRLDQLEVVSNITTKFFDAFACYGSSRRTIVVVMAISFTFQMLVIVAVYLMACSLHVSVPFYYFSAFVPLITLMEALPFSIYGIGIRDMGYVFFFGWAGMGDLQTRSLALLFLTMTLCYALIGGLLFLGRVLTSTAGQKAAANNDGG